MTTYRNKTTGEWGLTEQAIKSANPQKLYANIFSDDDYELVFAAPQPTYDSVTQTVRVIAPIFMEAKGHWEQQWEVVELYPVQVDKDAAIAADLSIKHTAKWEQIKAERDRRKAGGILLNTKWFHSDVDSRIQLFGLKDKARDMVAAGGLMSDNITILGNVVNWKTMDGTFVPMTGQLAFDIVTKTGDVDAQLHAKAEWHKSQMLASAAPASYDYSGGWVVIYGEVV